jgi:uncharacterized protein YjbJ (UPF0337 family)
LTVADDEIVEGEYDKRTFGTVILSFNPLHSRVWCADTVLQWAARVILREFPQCAPLNGMKRGVMTTKSKAENKTLEMKGKAEVLVGKVVGKAIQAKGVADQVESDLKNAGQDLKEAGKDLKKAARRVKKAPKKS